MVSPRCTRYATLAPLRQLRLLSLCPFHPVNRLCPVMLGPGVAGAKRGGRCWVLSRHCTGGWMRWWHWGSGRGVACPSPQCRAGEGMAVPGWHSPAVRVPGVKRRTPLASASATGPARQRAAVCAGAGPVKPPPGNRFPPAWLGTRGDLSAGSIPPQCPNLSRLHPREILGCFGGGEVPRYRRPP